MFIYQTDFCGPRQNVARTLWNVSWTIEAIEGFSNVIDVRMSLTRGSSVSDRHLASLRRTTNR